MKEYRLLKWYPSLVKEWKSVAFPIMVVEREDGYCLHPSLVARLATIDKSEVEDNEEYWQELIPDTYTTVDGESIREGNTFYVYDDKSIKPIYASYGHFTNKKYDGKRYKTRKEVEDLIELNKVQYSLKDIIRIANKLTSNALRSKDEILKLLAGKEINKIEL